VKSSFIFWKIVFCGEEFPIKLQFVFLMFDFDKSGEIEKKELVMTFQTSIRALCKLVHIEPPTLNVACAIHLNVLGTGAFRREALPCTRYRQEQVHLVYWVQWVDVKFLGVAGFPPQICNDLDVRERQSQDKGACHLLYQTFRNCGWRIRCSASRLGINENRFCKGA
jgi:hypothetical protein